MENKLTICLCAFSNPIESTEKYLELFDGFDVEIKIAPNLEAFSGFQERAALFNALIKEGFDYLVDLSGGDLANGMLPYIDYEAYKSSKTIFVGYSDLSVLINALYAKSNKPSLLFQAGFKAFPEELYALLSRKEESLSNPDFYELTSGLSYSSGIEHPIIGGNIRCFLKLAGTPYMPDFSGKTLFLEANSGSMTRLLSLFSQLAQLEECKNLKAIILGRFLELEDAYENQRQVDSVLLTLLNYAGLKAPLLLRTLEVGHQADSKALWIGKKEDSTNF